MKVIIKHICEKCNHEFEVKNISGKTHALERYEALAVTYRTCPKCEYNNKINIWIGLE